MAALDETPTAATQSIDGLKDIHTKDQDLNVIATTSTKLRYDNVHILPQTPQLIALLT